MVRVLMQKQCGCFIRSGYEAMKMFESKDDAMIYAQELCSDMNEVFCHKHRFTTVEMSENEFTISVDNNR